jgi:uncharacterized delta-60 repeat protein
MRTILYTTACIIFFYGITFGQPGTLDLSFGNDGIVYTQINGSEYTIDFPSDITVLQNGKILLAATDNDLNTGTNFALVRYNPDGHLDTTFGTDGIVVTTTTQGAVSSMAVQPDGKIVLAGYHSNNSQTDFQVVRYLTDGSLDPSFGSGGIVITDISGNNDGAESIVVQADGKIVAAGDARFGIQDDVAVVRYNEDGSLDPTFGNGGIVTTDIGNDDERGKSVAIQTDGKIVVAATYYNGITNNFAVIRYKTNGVPDPGFDNDGIAIIDSGLTTSMLLQPDGRIIVAGSANFDFCMVGFRTNGMTDSTFGINGKVLTDFENDNDAISSLVMQPDGKIIAVGSAEDFGDEPAVARYLANGELDPSYGTNGKVITSLGGLDDYGICAALQPDGKLVMGALYLDGYQEGYINVVRYLGDSVPECPIPGGLFIAESLPTVVKMEWDDVGFAIGYRLRYKIKGSNTWIPKNSVFHSKIITGLEPNTEYVWQVKSICSLSPLESSDWSEKQHFMTPLRLTEEPIFNTPLSVFPNPFSDNANVQFFVEKKEDLKIELKDLQGRKIKTIAEGNLEAGNHQFLLKNENLPAGIYYIQLISRSGLQTLKVILQ